MATATPEAAGGTGPTSPRKPQSAAMRAALKSFDLIERAGNLLPHPFWLFLILAVVVMILSAVLASAGVSVVNPGTGKKMVIKSLLTSGGIKEIFGNGVNAYATFPPLATVLVTMVGISIAQGSGLIDAVLRSFVTKVPAGALTFALAFTAMIGHVAGDSAYVVLIPLGALVFEAVGRSPILGAIIAFVSISAGYDASPSITTTDVLLSGISTAAAATVDKHAVVSPLSNYYFALASSVVVAATITLVVETILVKRTDLDVDTDYAAEHGATTLSDMQLKPNERRGLRWAGLAAVLFLGLVAAVLIPASSPFRGEGGSVTKSPLFTGMALLLWLFFSLVGIVYGFTAKTFHKPKEIMDAATKGIAELAPILVLFLAISLFLDFFKWTGMGEMLAVWGAEKLAATGLPMWAILLGVCVLISVLNFIITSGSAMWSLVAPIFIPMLMLLGTPPATTQALYRIADSVTNCVTPMSPYFVMALGFVQRWKKSAGIGTLASFTIPIAGVVWVVWVAFFFAWYGLKLPFGPGN